MTVEGLADFTNYTFTVAAYSAAGIGLTTPPETVSTVDAGYSSYVLTNILSHTHIAT